MKTKRYWLRGLIVGLIILALIQLVGVVLFFQPCQELGCLINIFFLFTPVLPLLPIIAIGSGIQDFAIVPIIIIGYLLYPFLGILIGLLYGKIKNRK